MYIDLDSTSNLFIYFFSLFLLVSRQEMRNKLIGEEIYAPFPRFLPGILLSMNRYFASRKDALDGNIDGRISSFLSSFQKSLTRFGCKNVKIDPFSWKVVIPSSGLNVSRWIYVRFLLAAVWQLPTAVLFR